MKKIAYLFVAIIGLTIASCGGVEEPVEDKVKKVVLKGYETLDLTEWGFNLTVMVPQADIHGNPEVTLTERGALEIVVGTGFGLEIMYGDADLALLKADLQEDLVFTSEILQEEEKALIYSQNIPDAGVKTQNHFLYKAEIGAEIFEVRDVIDGEFGTGMIEKMLEAAKTIKSANEAAV
tara:strand:+ start:13489 stop:14025 length:537 start_codon:yes stop_codon:yes gene_type:complete